MSYIANEKDVERTVKDFTAFCDYIIQNAPTATSKGNLDTKTCFELNRLLSSVDENAKPTYRIESYPSLLFWVQIAQESGILTYGEAKKGRNRFVITENYELFKKTNAFTQYMTLFHTWQHLVNPQELYDQRTMFDIEQLNLIDVVFFELSKASASKWVECDESCDIFSANPLQRLMNWCCGLVEVMGCFGLLEFEKETLTTKQNTKTFIRRLRPTPFGQAIMGACQKRQLSWVNLYLQPYVELGEIELFEREEENCVPGSKLFFQPFLPCFSKNSLDVNAINQILFKDEQEGIKEENRLFEFVVTLRKDCFACIHCSAVHTFEDLHMAIQKAFRFDDDHLYAFYMDGKKNSNNVINDARMETPPFSDEVYIGKKRLRERQHILYIFDFGHCWKFDIFLKSIQELDKPLDAPKIVVLPKKVPAQYGR